MTTITNTADYIILKLKEGEEDLNLLKLQKLLYYVQAWSLVFTGNRMFDGRFQAWVHGPVNRETYNRFKEVKSLYSEVTMADIAADFSAENIDQADRTIIDEVLESYGKFTGTQLEELTHGEEPWIKARGDLPAAARCETEIDEQLMKDFYGKRVA